MSFTRLLIQPSPNNVVADLAGRDGICRLVHYLRYEHKIQRPSFTMSAVWVRVFRAKLGWRNCRARKAEPGTHEA